MDFSGGGSVKLSGINAYGAVTTNTQSFKNISKNTDYGDIEFVDYSQIPVASVSNQITNLSIEDSKSSNYNLETFGTNLTKNSIFYFGTTYADDILSSIKPILGSAAKSTMGKVATSSIVKGLAAFATGGSVFTGLTEGGIKKVQTEVLYPKVTSLTSSAFSKIAKKAGIDLSENSAKRIAELSSKKNIWSNIAGGKTLSDKKYRYNSWNKKYEIIDRKAGITMGSFASAIGVDYFASVATNIFVGKVVNHHDWGTVLKSDSKLGSTFLKSTWKVACATACENLFAFAGPAGKKFGKAFGSVVGAEIGTFCTDVMFDNDEGWCAAAGAATAICATAAGVLVTAAIAASAVTISVPVAGVFVGAAILVGAAVGTLIMWGAKALFG